MNNKFEGFICLYEIANLCNYQSILRLIAQFLKEAITYFTSRQASEAPNKIKK